MDPLIPSQEPSGKQRNSAVAASAWQETKKGCANLWSTIKLIAPAVCGSLYLLWWDKKFSVRQRLGIWAGWGLFFIIFVDVVINPMMHSISFERVPMPARISLTAAFAVCALIVVLHHRRLEKRLQRHRILVDAVRALGVDAARLEGSQTLQSLAPFIRKALRSLVFVVEQGNNQKPCAFGAMLLRTSTSDAFGIFEQSPPGRYPSTLMIDGTRSAAARVSKYSADETLYIPWTRFRHGVKIVTVQEDPALSAVHLRTESVAEAMYILEGKDAADYLPGGHPRARRSLMCSRIPFSHHHADSLRNVEAVLCVETNKRACLGELDFHAIQVIGILIGSALREV